MWPGEKGNTTAEGRLIAFAPGRVRAGAHNEIVKRKGCANAERGPADDLPPHSGDESLEAGLLQFAIEHLSQDARARPIP